jgi:hypothetical protein
MATVNFRGRKMERDWRTPNGMEEIIYRLETRHKPRLLSAMMHALAAEESKISFEGTLSQTELARMEGVTNEETGVLKRGTLQPKLDFLVLPLTQQGLAAMEKAINSKIAFGYKGIVHVQIERMGRLHSLRTTIFTKSVSSPILPFPLHCSMS